MFRVLLILAALLAGLPGAAGAAYTSLYVFGDSLSDSGNAFALSGGIWPPSPPYARQFSNGPVAAQQLAANLALPLAPAVAGGSNYAIGGATTGVQNYNFEVQSPFPLPPALDNTGVLAQVGGFVAARPAFAPGEALFVIWAGPNDLFLALSQGSSPTDAIAAAAANLTTAVGALAGIGARRFLLPNIPNLAETPWGLAQAPADRSLLDALSAGFNSALAQAMVQLGALPGLELTGFDTAAFLHQVVSSPGEFGFSNVTDPCFDPARPADLANAAGGCQGYLYFDSLHPTAATHARLGDRFYAALQVPEPATWALLAAALAGLLPACPGRREPARRSKGSGASAACPAGRSTA